LKRKQKSQLDKHYAKIPRPRGRGPVEA